MRGATEAGSRDLGGPRPSTVYSLPDPERVLVRGVLWGAPAGPSTLATSFRVDLTGAAAAFLLGEAATTRSPRVDQPEAIERTKGTTDGVTLPLSTASVTARTAAARSRDPAMSRRVAGRASRDLHRNWGYRTARSSPRRRRSTRLGRAPTATFEVDVPLRQLSGAHASSRSSRRQVIRRILGHLGVAKDPRPLPRARDPDDEVVASADAERRVTGPSASGRRVPERGSALDLITMVHRSAANGSACEGRHEGA